MVVLSFIAFIVICLLIDAIVNAIKKKKAEGLDTAIENHKLFDEKSIAVPLGIFFDKSHTWAFMDKNGMVKIGVNDFLQQVTGAITRIELKEAGKPVRKGEPLITLVQAGKRVVLKAPVSGKIVATNHVLKNHSGMVNSSPYNDGWIYKLEPQNWLRDAQFMMMADQARDWIKKEVARLKDFLAVTLSKNNDQFAYTSLQDGGELKSGVMSSMGPEIWEEFQANFIDTAR